MKTIEYGVTVSRIACDNYKQEPVEVIKAITDETGITRFRLMSYWHLMERERGRYDFSDLDAQVKAVERINGTVTLCLGLRQPRWPECHIPQWAIALESNEERYECLYSFITAVVQRYKDKGVVVSYQLENEALNHGIGTCENYDRERLRTEYNLVQYLDPTRPILMSTSNSWGLPARKPKPDSIGFSYYLYEWKNDGPTTKPIPWQLHWVRRVIAKYVFRKHSFCHELQCEPWGPKGNERLTNEQQVELMDADRLKNHIEYAQKTGVSTIDMWGAEWWVWRKTEFDDPSLLSEVASLTS